MSSAVPPRGGTAHPGGTPDPDGPEPPATATAAATPAAEDWRPIADRIARQGQDFLDGVTAVASGEGEDETVPLLLLEVAQILLAGAQPGAGKDIIPPGNWEPARGRDPGLCGAAAAA